MVCATVQENFTIMRVVSMMGTGKTILCMGKEAFITLMGNLLMKEAGEWMNFMDLAKYITKINNK